MLFDLKRSLKEGYDRAGISIPFPQMDVHLVKEEMEKNKVEK